LKSTSLVAVPPVLKKRTVMLPEGTVRPTRVTVTVWSAGLPSPSNWSRCRSWNSSVPASPSSRIVIVVAFGTPMCIEYTGSWL